MEIRESAKGALRIPAVHDERICGTWSELSDRTMGSKNNNDG